MAGVHSPSCCATSRAHAALLQMSCGPTARLVAREGLGSPRMWIRYSFLGLRETPVLHCKGVWVLGVGGRGRWGGPCECRCQPRARAQTAFCVCPIDRGCSGTLPWVSSMGVPESQRDQPNGPTRAALTADARTKSREQARQREEVHNVHKRGDEARGGDKA